MSPVVGLSYNRGPVIMLLVRPTCPSPRIIQPQVCLLGRRDCRWYQHSNEAKEKEKCKIEVTVGNEMQDVSSWKCREMYSFNSYSADLGVSGQSQGNWSAKGKAKNAHPVAGNLRVILDDLKCCLSIKWFKTWWGTNTLYWIGYEVIEQTLSAGTQTYWLSFLLPHK